MPAGAKIIEIRPVKYWRSLTSMDKTSAEERVKQGNAKFKEGQSALQQKDVSQAVRCFEEAAKEYSIAGDDKKKQLLEGMVMKLRKEYHDKSASTQNSKSSPSSTQKSPTK